MASETDDPGDEQWTVDDVEYINAIRYANGVKIVSASLPSLALDSLRLKQVPRNHPAFPGRGCFANVNLFAGTIIGVYAGVLRPGSFGRDNGYVFSTKVEKSQSQWVTDAATCGNITRFINDPRGSNHEPNIAAYDGIVSGGCLYENLSDLPGGQQDSVIPVVYFETISDIESGNELFYNYETGASGYWGPAQDEPVDLSSSQQQINAAAIIEELVGIRRQFELCAFQFGRRMGMLSYSGEPMEILNAWRNENGWNQRAVSVDSLERLFRDSRELVRRLHQGGIATDLEQHLEEHVLLDLNSEEDHASAMELDHEEEEGDGNEEDAGGAGIPAVHVVAQVCLWQATPNGEISPNGRAVTKRKGAPNGWNCEVVGSVSYNAGVHEWRLLMPDGGGGVAVGICRDNIPSLVDHSANKPHCISLHCATGTATKTKVFANCSASGTQIMMRLDFNQHTLLFGINGNWNAAPSFVNLGPGPWTPYVGLYYPNRIVTIS